MCHCQCGSRCLEADSLRRVEDCQALSMRAGPCNRMVQIKQLKGKSLRVLTRGSRIHAHLKQACTRAQGPPNTERRFSFRRRFSDPSYSTATEVTLQQPAGGDVSHTTDAVGSVLFGMLASSRPPSRSTEAARLL